MTQHTKISKMFIQLLDVQLLQIYLIILYFSPMHFITRVAHVGQSRRAGQKEHTQFRQSIGVVVCFKLMRNTKR